MAVKYVRASCAGPRGRASIFLPHFLRRTPKTYLDGEEGSLIVQDWRLRYMNLHDVDKLFFQDRLHLMVYIGRTTPMSFLIYVNLS
jgi:hypothetical protein